MARTGLSPHSLIVSLHDVSPVTFDLSRRICDDLEARGIKEISLLVIPNHHHRGHFLDHKPFLEWLHSMIARGHEAVIHGYYHQRAARPEESAKTRAITRLYTAGEGEFFDIEAQTATALLVKAREEFRAVGFNPSGFIAPAWLLSDQARNALRALGFSYTTLLREVIDLQQPRSYISQSLVYSTRAAWRRVCSLAWNATLFRSLQAQPLMRLGIHPPEITYPRIWKQITDLAGRALEQRTALTYHNWVASQA